MQELVTIYEQNKELIQKFIKASLHQVDTTAEDYLRHLFEVFPSLELIYECDNDFIQTSKNYMRNKEEEKQIGADRSYITQEKEALYYFSEAYISTATQKLCVTLVYKTEKGFLFLDFSLRALLERFDLIVSKKGFNRLNDYAYTLIGGGLIFFGLFAVLYSFFTFGGYLFGSEALTLDAVFKPIIALTLGLAVYDLGKTILEQEVVFKSKKLIEGIKTKTLLNFSVSIIIALLIEALLVVFKISITDYKDLPYAASLIISLAVLMAVFSYFTKIVTKKKHL